MTKPPIIPQGVENSTEILNAKSTGDGKTEREGDQKRKAQLRPMGALVLPPLRRSQLAPISRPPLPE
jgi:hypothetical protein